MKAILIAIVLSVMSTQVMAIVDKPIHNPTIAKPGIGYDSRNMMFPSEGTVDELPEYIPCVKMDMFGIRCNWMFYPRTIYVQSTVPGELVGIKNEVAVICRRGDCRNEYGYAGNFPQDINATINFWYRLEESTDGQLIAVRRDIEEVVSYRYTGVSLYLWFLGMGPNEEQAQALMDHLYYGGWKQLVADWNAMCEDPSHDFSYCGD